MSGNGITAQQSVVKTTIKKGDSPWSIASRNLKAQNQKVTNQAIINEMNRLAKLNGCSDYKDFGKKYFNKVGNEVIIEKKAATKTNKVNRASFPRVQNNISVADNTRVVTTRPVVNPKKIVDPKAEYVAQINKLGNDKDKIIEWNKDNYKYDYYGIVDKKSCKLLIYNKAGKVVKSLTVGIGKGVGDGLANKIDNRNTTAGEFTLDEYSSPKTQVLDADEYAGSDGKYRFMGLRGDNVGDDVNAQIAIHIVWQPEAKKRNMAIDSQDLADNRMSYGCVNLREEDYDEMHRYLGEGQKIYVLPEEKGNKLVLEKQPNGTYKFEQLHHRQDKRGQSVADSSKVVYDVRPDRRPA